MLRLYTRIYTLNQQPAISGVAHFHPLLITSVAHHIGGRRPIGTSGTNSSPSVANHIRCSPHPWLITSVTHPHPGRDRKGQNPWETPHRDVWDKLIPIRCSFPSVANHIRCSFPSVANHFPNIPSSEFAYSLRFVRVSLLFLRFALPALR